MTWGKMDDKFHRNHKVRDLRRTKGGREALGDWAFWWSWCLDDASLTGFVPIAELAPSERRSAKLLVSVGLWDEVEKGFRFHDFHEYNPTKAQREHKKSLDRERLADKRSGCREDVASDILASRERVASESRPARVPVPTQPDPDPIPTEEEQQLRDHGRPPLRDGSSQMLSSLDPSNEAAIGAYRAGASRGGVRVPVNHRGRFEQAHRLRNAVSDALPPGATEEARLELIRAAAAEAAKDEDHRKAGTPFAWFVANVGRYIERAQEVAPETSATLTAVDAAIEVVVARVRAAEAAYRAGLGEDGTTQRKAALDAARAELAKARVAA